MQQQPNLAPMWSGLCVFIFALAIIGFVIFLWGTIFRKAGYSFWMSLLMLVPIANLIWLLVFAFSKWPIEQELEHYRGQIGYSGRGFPVQMPPPPQMPPPMR